MKKRKSTKKALLASTFTLLTCVTMLIGTTFAWFTDTASTSINKIQSGTLDIQLIDADGNSLEGKTLSFKKLEGHEDEELLWEPGSTYELQPVYVKNNGNLALKYKVSITGIQGDAKLNDAIEWTIKVDGQIYDISKEHSLAANSSEAITISGHMKEDAGNEYQGLSIDGIAITVTATQDTVEYDSEDNQYDKDATYPVYATATKNVAVKDDGSGNKLVETAVTLTTTEKAKDATAETPIATASVPENTKLEANATSLTLIVKEDTTDSNIKVDTATEEAKTFEVHMNGLDNENNEGIIKIELYVGEGLGDVTLYHNDTQMKKVTTSADNVSEDNSYFYNSSTGVITMAVSKFSPFTIVYNAASAELERIKKTYSADGMNMPSGVKITSLDNEGNNTFEIVLEDEEAFIYFTQVFDCSAAYEARKAALNAGTITKYGAEKSADLNMWYGAYTSGITVKMGCDVDLKGMTVSPVKFGGNYGPNFDGCGHTISNAKMNGTSGDIGFFNGNKSVSNVTFDNFKVYATGATNAGIVFGQATGKITNVIVKNSSVIGGRFAGAIAGSVYGSITNCKVENTVVSGQYKVGGILGQMMESGDAQITGNVLTNVTVKGDNIWSGKTEFVLGKVLGCWAHNGGNCKNNTITNITSEATSNIGEIATGYSVTQD